MFVYNRTKQNMLSCTACGRMYSTQGNLKRHLESSKVCEEWTRYKPDSRIYPQIYNIIQDNSITTSQVLQALVPALNDDHTCKYCGKVFASGSALAKHMRSSVACDKWRLHELLLNAQRLLSNDLLSQQQQSCSERLQSFVEPDSDSITVVPAPTLMTAENSHAAFEAPKYSIAHIIWNIFLVDKEFAKTQDMSTVCRDNKVTYIVAILPDDEERLETLPGVECSLMSYSGHDLLVDITRFNIECEAIEARRAIRENVIVYCNSGYQRSIPFLCYYLFMHHRDEVPSLEQALDIILPQVDKNNYATVRPKYLESITSLFKSNDLI